MDSVQPSLLRQLHGSMSMTMWAGSWHLVGRLVTRAHALHHSLLHAGQSSRLPIRHIHHAAFLLLTRTPNDQLSVARLWKRAAPLHLVHNPMADLKASIGTVACLGPARPLSIAIQQPGQTLFLSPEGSSLHLDLMLVLQIETIRSDIS